MSTYFTLSHTYFEPKSQFLTNHHTSLVGIVTRMRTGRPMNLGSILGWSKNDFFNNVRTGTGAHSAFWSMSSGGPFPGDKADRLRSWKLHLVPGLRIHGVVAPFPHTLSCLALGQLFLHSLQTRKVHYRTQKSLLLDSIQNRKSPLHSLETCFNIILTFHT
jgi:hypothetical protein